MENAAEALKIGAWVLIFIVALSIGINSFTQARQTMDTILEYNDREYSYTYIEENGSTQRDVGYEAIIPTIYRAYKENYKIIFPENDYVLYYKIDSLGNKEEVNYIDLEKETLGSDEMKEEFIKGILYGKENVDTSKFPNIEFRNKNQALFNRLKNETLREYLGVYYQEETENAEESSTPDANKTKKRVITYEKV